MEKGDKIALAIFFMIILIAFTYVFVEHRLFVIKTNSELDNCIGCSIPEEYLATEDEPLILPRELLQGKVNQQSAFSPFFAFVYNPSPTPVESVVVEISECTGNIDFSGIKSTPQTMPNRTSVAFKIYIPKDKLKNPGKGVCTVKAVPLNVSRQMAVEIRE